MEDFSLLFKLTAAKRWGEASDSSGLSRKHLLLKKLSQMQRIKKKNTYKNTHCNSVQSGEKEK